MINEAKNKAMKPEAEKVAADQYEFHFSGTGEYEPITIRAADYIEAEAEWKKRRKAVSRQEKVEDNEV